MSFIADLHIHSYYSRATSKELNLEHLHKWAQLKGLQVVATGDFTHPKWLDELSEKLEPAEPGLYQLKSEFARTTQEDVHSACKGPVRFILSTEISSIYKKNDRVRKVHNVLMVPSLEAAARLQTRLDKIGNIHSDGRPILGLDSRDLLEIVLETDALACLIPAHIWTPWFSVLGSKSGFDGIDECFGDLTSHIFAVETGLSSDPPMNWRVSQLDRFTLVSNSDAHSPQKLAREANIFHCELSYPAMLNAMKDRSSGQFGGTIEFFPEEGKYHLDGHRKCNARLEPRETIANNGLCPVCGKPVTVGVLYRVEELADRPAGTAPSAASPFQSLIPLPEVVAEVKNVGPNTKTVRKVVHTLLNRLGNELAILRDIPLPDIEKVSGSLVAEAVRRMRTGELYIAGGYDGEFGTIHIFSDEERAQFDTLQFSFAENFKKPRRQPEQATLFVRDEDDSDTWSGVQPAKAIDADEEKKYGGLNKHQYDAVHSHARCMLIVAGPGTGKTRTITHRIAWLIDRQHVSPQHILAVTFTNKAAGEMQERLSDMLQAKQVKALTIKTFHALGAAILREQCEKLSYSPQYSIYNEADRYQFLRGLFPDRAASQLKEFIARLSEAKNLLLLPDQCHDDSDFPKMYEQYQHSLKRAQAVDFDDLLLQTVLLLRGNLDIRNHYQQRFQWIFVDEYQDINHAQYQLLKLLITDQSHLCVIGDPDQAIYGFRGSDVTFFQQFQHDYPDAITIQLEKNYRSTQNIVKACTQVIARHPEREETALRPSIISEGKLDIIQTATDKAEAETIVHIVEQLVGATSFFSVDSDRAGYEDTSYCRGFADIAVLFRTSAQLLALEEAFIRSGIPFQTAGEIPFTELPEVREVLSYIRLLINPHSDIDLLRILNVPPRGIGDQTLRVLQTYRKTNQLSLWDAIKRAHYISSLSVTQRRPVQRFVEKIEQLQQDVQSLPLSKWLAPILVESGIKAYYKDDSKRQYYWDELHERMNHRYESARDFLEHISLQHETDAYDPHAEKVTLMTLHASKGLEFPVVFITGCEDGLLPFRMPDRQFDINEERRLFYVGMSRAQHKLILTRANSRFLFGKRHTNPPSPFLADIEVALKNFRKTSPVRKRRTDDRSPANNQLSLF